MIDKVGGIAVEQTAVETILTELATVDAVVASSGGSSSSMGSLKKADDVEWYNTTTESAGASTDALTRGKMLVERLRQCFGVQLGGKYFGTAPPLDNEMALG
jgi:hypothetical protein